MRRVDQKAVGLTTIFASGLCGGDGGKGGIATTRSLAVIAGELVLQAGGDALEHELGDFFIEAEGRGDVVADAGMFGGGLGGELGDVGSGVAAGERK